MGSTDTRIRRVVECGIFHASLAQRFHSLGCDLPQIFNRAKLDGLGWTCLGAGRDHSRFLPVITEGAFERATIIPIAFDYAEWAGHNTIGAAIANIRLNEYPAEFCANNRTRGAGFQASGVLAMLAYIGGKRPGVQLGRVSPKSRLRSLLDKLHVPPRLCADRARIVVGKTTPVKAIFANIVPFFAGNFTSLATDAQRRICQKCSCGHGSDRLSV